MPFSLALEVTIMQASLSRYRGSALGKKPSPWTLIPSPVLVALVEWDGRGEEEVLVLQGS